MELKELYDRDLTLYADRENVFKKLGKEIYFDWLVNTNFKKIDMIKYDKEIKKIDEELQLVELNINMMEK